MTSANVMLGLIAQTSIHAGTGSAVGAVDLPIQREGHSGWPCIFGASVKGAIRAKAYHTLKPFEPETFLAIFGDSNANDAHAGSMSVGDARLLLLPVRSLTSAFKWVTCPAVLQRLKRDYQLLGQSLDLNVPTIDGDTQALWMQADNALFLEEYRFAAKKYNLDKIADSIANLLAREDFAKSLKEQLVIVSDDMFTYLANQATPVNAHIAIKDDGSKTVATGALWYEETLPPETVLYVPMMIQASRRNKVFMQPVEILETLKSTVFAGASQWLQLGGNETVGMGWCQVKLNPIKTGA